jgi:hypothetical protein
VLDALAGSYTMGAEYGKAIAVLHQMQGLQQHFTSLLPIAIAGGEIPQVPQRRH